MNRIPIHRLCALRLLVLLVVGGLIGRLYHLQLIAAADPSAVETNNVSTTRWKTVTPLRGEIVALNGAQPLAVGQALPAASLTKLAETVQRYTIAVAPADLPPPESFQRAYVFAQLSEVLALSSTLTISPTAALQTRAGLRAALVNALGEPTRTFPSTSDAFTLTIAPMQAVPMAAISYAYSDVLRVQTHVDAAIAPVEAGRLPNWQTVPIKQDVGRELALVVWENSATLPGIVVEEDYARRYRHSATTPSLSHLLGYIGRINACELVLNNPAPTWVDGLLGSMAQAAHPHNGGVCGIIPKQIDPRALVARYRPDDRIGKDGLEYVYERELRGEVGVESLLVDVLDRQVGPLQPVSAAKSGSNLVLTLDLALQQQTEAILKKWLTEADRRRVNAADAFKRNYAPITNGVALAVDPRSGKLLASVSLPAYDNNMWVDPQRSSELTALLAPPPETVTETARLAVLNNRAIAGQYPPGSTLKQFVGAVALQSQIIAPDTRLHDPGELLVRDKYVAERTFRYPNSVPGDRGAVTVSDALRYSSNVFFQSVAGGNNQQVINLAPDDWRTDGMPLTSFIDGLKWFGFGQETGLAPRLESSGRVPTPMWKQQALREAWTTGDTYNMAIGQGNMLVTPLQLVMAASAVANGGTLYRPWLVQATTDPAGTVTRVMQPEIIRQVPIDAHYLHVIREGMRRSVTEGSNIAARAECSGLAIAGKTGTAEYGAIITETGLQASHALFVGFAPYDNPEIAVVVLIEGAGDLGDGSATLAVPAVTEIMQAYFDVAPPAEQPASCFGTPS
jgi:penicillin-binding protein 2